MPNQDRKQKAPRVALGKTYESSCRSRRSSDVWLVRLLDEIDERLLESSDDFCWPNALGN